MTWKQNGWQKRETDDEGFELHQFWIARWTRLDLLFPMRLLKSKNMQVQKWNGWIENETDDQKEKRIVKEIRYDNSE